MKVINLVRSRSDLNNANMHKLGWIVLASLCVASARPQTVPASQPVPSVNLTFEKDIRPILRTHCLDCHGSQNVRKGGLDLRLQRLMAKGGESGPAIAPGHPEESYLLDRLKTGEMPPGDQKLTPAEVAVIDGWIRGGA